MNDKLLIEFGRIVTAFRLCREMSQVELARQSGLHRSYICSVEKGRRNVSLKNIVQLASALGVTPSNLVEGVDCCSCPDVVPASDDA